MPFISTQYSSKLSVKVGDIFLPESQRLRIYQLPNKNPYLGFVCRLNLRKKTVVCGNKASGLVCFIDRELKDNEAIMIKQIKHNFAIGEIIQQPKKLNNKLGLS